jgi:hypothetical protein
MTQHISRRCLICAALNPCRQHSAEDQRAELARNDAEIAKIRLTAIEGGATGVGRTFTTTIGKLRQRLRQRRDDQ